MICRDGSSDFCPARSGDLGVPVGDRQQANDHPSSILLALTLNEEAEWHDVGDLYLKQPGRVLGLHLIEHPQLIFDAAVVAQGVGKTLDFLGAVWDFLADLAAAFF